MKHVLFAVALVAGSASVSAFAQASAPTQPAPISPAAQHDQWTPPNGQPTVQKTRAEVYQELVEAERDGQMAYLNSTVYAHP